ncbi:hypothetical protein [Legionella gresilensis]|uniref:hypothetical protein n=1 Tax=Legionella gresilensis TaxID=91823 RepID=UPI001041514F|nr:hypothetical protein [Legionella gresilensis]
MKNSLLEIYKIQLETYKDKSTTISEKKLIESLIEELNKVTTLSEVIKLFSSVIQEQTSSKSDPGFLENILARFKKRPKSPVKTVYDQLSEWNKEARERLAMVNEVKDNLFKVSEKIKDINNYKKIEPLINLLKELFKNEDLLLLNTRGKSLLAYLKSANLQAVLEYLANLPSTPPAVSFSQPLSMFSSSSLRGSFDAQPIVDDIHKDCKLLIGQMAKAYSDSCDSYWEDSNSLLQTAVPIYTDIKEFLKNDLVVEYN